MDNSWRSVVLRDIVTEVAMGPFGSDLKTSNFVPSGVPVVRGGNLGKGRFSDEGLVFVTPEKAASLRNSIARKGEIVITHRGTLGQAVVIPELAEYDEYLISQSQMRVKPDPEQVDSNYLHYWFQSEMGQRELLSFASQTGVPALARPVTNVKLIQLMLPVLGEQRAIAEVLGALDGKIELNRKMNATLDELARTIFRSWFVDFNPVRAKMKGREPLGMDADTAALFPDHLVDSPRGPIPEGWETKFLGEATTILRRGIAPKYIESDGVLVLNQRCIRDGRIQTDNARRHDPNLRSIVGRELELWDVLVNSTGVGTLGRVAQVLEIPETMVCDSHVTVVRADESYVTANFLGLSLSNRQSEIEALGHGSTGQTELSRKALAQLAAVLPSLRLQRRFDELTVPFRRMTAQNDRESQNLVGLRDTLLPELISGRIRVPEAEKAVAEVV